MTGKPLILLIAGVCALMALGVIIVGLLNTAPSPGQQMRAAVQQDIRQLKIIVRSFQAERGRVPTEQEFDRIIARLETELDQPLRDPWGRRYIYEQPGPHGHPFEIRCHGADGQPTGQGLNAPISSTELIPANDNDF